jgi:hypothetical protein
MFLQTFRQLTAKLVICPVCKQNGQRSVSSFWITQLRTPKIDGGYFDLEGIWQQPKIAWRFWYWFSNGHICEEKV